MFSQNHAGLKAEPSTEHCVILSGRPAGRQTDVSVNACVCVCVCVVHIYYIPYNCA